MNQVSDFSRVKREEIENLAAVDPEYAKELEAAHARALERKKAAQAEVEAAQKLAAEQKTQAEAEAAQKLADAQKAQAEAEAAQKLAVEQKTQAEAEAAQKLAAEQKARAEAEAAQKLAAEQKAQAEAEAAQKLAAEQKAQAEAEAAQKLAAEQKAQAEAEAAQKLAAEQKAQAEAEAAQKLAAEQKAQAEAEAAQKLAAEQKAQAEAEAAQKLADAQKAEVAAPSVSAQLPTASASVNEGVMAVEEARPSPAPAELAGEKVVEATPNALAVPASVAAVVEQPVEEKAAEQAKKQLQSPADDAAGQQQDAGVAGPAAGAPTDGDTSKAQAAQPATAVDASAAAGTVQSDQSVVKTTVDMLSETSGAGSADVTGAEGTDDAPAPQSIKQPMRTSEDENGKDPFDTSLPDAQAPASSPEAPQPQPLKIASVWGCHNDIFELDTSPSLPIIVDLGEGRDGIVLSGLKADYRLTQQDEKWTVSHIDGGTAELRGVEWVQFKDGVSLLSEDPGAVKGYMIAKAASGDMPDLPRVFHIADHIDRGTLNSYVANILMKEEKFQLRFDASHGTPESVSQYYMNILGRAPDEGGSQGWLTVATKVTPESMFLSFAMGDEAKATAMKEVGMAAAPDASFF
ncbi:hypothetical protein CHELA1G11_14302 [Hyphomicrobiales bacterium]|nr:hypothetical protein CHELA1G11_14302 [Hyphomicrobiales bacterium]